jgi:hypothetical protein
LFLSLIYILRTLPPSLSGCPPIFCASMLSRTDGLSFWIYSGLVYS